MTPGRLLLAVASALSLACAGPQPVAEKPVRGERPYRAFQVLEARDFHLNAHDAAGAAAQYAADAEVASANTGAVLRGREAIERDLRELFARCPAFSIDVLERSFSDEGRVATGVERIRCRRGAESTQAVRYEIGDAGITRVFTRAAAPTSGAAP
jgi:hypothetical protein